MKTTLFLVACLFTLAIGRADGAILIAGGTIERLSIDDYQLNMTIEVYATHLFELGEPDITVPYYFGLFGPPAFSVSGNFSPSPIGGYDNNLSTVVQPFDPGTIFLSLIAAQDYFWYQADRPEIHGYLATVIGQGNFYAALPQEIGTSSNLIQTPEASSSVLFALGLITLFLLSPKRPSMNLRSLGFSQTVRYPGLMGSISMSGFLYGIQAALLTKPESPPRLSLRLPRVHRLSDDLDSLGYQTDSLFAPAKLPTSLCSIGTVCHVATSLALNCNQHMSGCSGST